MNGEVEEPGPATHLTPAARQLLHLPDAERIARIRADRWVDTPRAVLALGKLADLLDSPPRARMPNVLIWGDSGMGKTMIAEKFLRDHPPIFDATAGVRRTPVLAIDMPAIPDPKWLFAQILQALDAPLPGGGRIDLATLAPRTIRLMQMIGVRLLVIDEVHNLLVGPHRSQRAMLNVIRQLANELPAYQPITPLRIDGPPGEPGSGCGGAAELADHTAHVAPVIGRPAKGTEVVGQMLGRKHLVGRLQRGAEIGDQGVDVEERAAALALRTLAPGNGGDVSASALAEDVKS